MTVSSTRELLHIQEATGKCNGLAFLHLKIDTGVGRLGCSTNLIEEIHTVVRQSPMIQINGVFTPFADAENDHVFTLEQKKQFSGALWIISKFSQLPEDVHASNSGSIIYDRSFIGNMVGPSLMVYGVMPSGKRKAKQKLIRQMRSALSFHRRVSYLKWISKGISLGYGRTFTVNQKCKLALLHPVMVMVTHRVFPIVPAF